MNTPLLPNGRQSLDNLLRTAAESGDVPGVAALVTTGEGLIYEGAFGVRALGEPAAMTTDTVVWLASMTKIVTAAAAMQLVERGRLHLDQPVGDHVAELREVRLLEGWSEDGSPRLRPPRRPVTLRDLLTHTSGFGHEIWNAGIGRYQAWSGLPSLSTCRNAALRMPLLFEPGARWNYSIGIDWTGKVIEAVAGMPLGQYLTANLLGPLGMHDTSFRITPSMRARLARVHQRDESGRLAPTAFEMPQDGEFEPGGGGLYGTPADYARFLRMFLGRGQLEGRRVLAEQTVAAMSRNEIGGLRVLPMASVNAKRSRDGELLPGVDKGWSLAALVNLEAVPAGRSAGSLAWGGLPNTYYWIDPAAGIAGAFFTQILPFFDEIALPLFAGFETLAYRNLRALRA